MDDLSANAAVIERELAWLSDAIHQRLGHYFDGSAGAPSGPDAPALPDSGGTYGRTVEELELGAHERLALILVLAPHVRPQALDAFLTQNQQTGKRFTEFGGRVVHDYFLPTIETALFLLAGDNLELRLRLRRLLAPAGRLVSSGLLDCEAGQPGLPDGAPPLRLSSDGLARLLGEAASCERALRAGI
ncbi:hypothetical protein [Pseudoduganella sp. GCM10020061]|uniref:hypothetical protein n=1 Tax=Pseudoduganella sp. GCM10020061 TaxID=3317345 RepID=UPI003629A8E8